MLNPLDQLFRFDEAALRLRGQRQQVLASNIANADTPNYKARDIDFKSALESAMATGGATPGAAAAQGAAEPTLLYRSARQGSIDGNTVDMDVERSEFADNAIRYEAGITEVNVRIHNLLAAIQG